MKHTLALASVLTLFLLCPVRAAPAIAQLVDVSGTVRVKHNGKQEAAVLLHPLEAGDVVTVAADGHAEVVLLSSGQRYALPAGSTVRLAAVTVETVAGSPPRALATLKLPRKIQSPVSSRVLGLVVRGGPAETQGPRDLRPNGAVRGGPVTLSWAGPIDGKEIELRIRGEDRSLLRTLLPVTARDFVVPQGVLAPGVFLVWSVTAISDAGDALQTKSAVLRLLTPAELAQLQSLTESLQKERTSQPQNPAPHLILARASEDLGLYDEALGHYRAALQLRPNQPQIEEAVRRLDGGAPAAR